MTDNMGDMVTWYSSEQGANCPQNICPLGIFPAKEDKELLIDASPKIECEVAKRRFDKLERALELIKKGIGL